MARGDRPFVRVYHDDLQRDYPGIWDDDRLLANWLRLLVVADKLWPAPGEVPRSIRRRILEALVETKIVSLLPLDRFKIRGLDTERQARSDRARAAAEGRWGQRDDDADGNAGSNAPRIPPGSPSSNASRARGHTRALRPPDSDSVWEETDDVSRPPEDPETPALAWLASVGATVVPDGNGYHRELVGFVERRGSEAVVAAMARRHDAGDRTARQLLYGAMNDLERIHRPSNPGKAPKGYQPTDDEVESAFQRPLRSQAKEPVS
jgi:hypothetical protein